MVRISTYIINHVQLSLYLSFITSDGTCFESSLVVLTVLVSTFILDSTFGKSLLDITQQSTITTGNMSL